MVAHAKADLPNECCGILAGPGGQVMKSYRMANVEASPYRFVMDPVELGNVDSDAGDNDWELLAIYHSHTGSEDGQRGSQPLPVRHGPGGAGQCRFRRWG